METLREIVLKEPTLYTSREFDKLNENCIYFLIDKSKNGQIGILKFLQFDICRYFNDLELSAQMKETLKSQLSGWYLLDLFYPHQQCFHTGQWDNKIEIQDIPKLLENFHLIEIEDEYIDSTHIYETKKRYNTAISEICRKIASIKQYP